MRAFARVAVSSIVVTLLAAAVASAVPVTVFSADFDAGYTVGGLLGQPVGHGASPYWDALYPGCADAAVVAGVGLGGTNASAWTWNSTGGGHPPASDVLVHNLTDPGRTMNIEYRMAINMANQEADYAIMFDAYSSSGTIFEARFGNGYYLADDPIVYAGLAAGGTFQLSTHTFNRNAYHTLVATVKYDVSGSSPKDTIELWVDGVKEIGPVPLNVAALDNIEVWVDGNDSAAYGPIYLDSLWIGQVGQEAGALVPEPAAFGLLLLGAPVVLRRRRS